MTEMLYLPVSLGEGLDKLSILDIKLDKITDKRRANVQIEYDILYNKLQNFIEKYHFLYEIMKKINLDIWDMMDILRDGEISDNDYLHVCRKTVLDNDIRFRIKNKINTISASILKEEKGYNITKICVDCKNIRISELDKIVPIIRYYSFRYDEIVIVTNEINVYLLKNTFIYDPTISIVKERNGDENFVKMILFEEEDDESTIYSKSHLKKDMLDMYNYITN